MLLLRRVTGNIKASKLAEFPFKFRRNLWKMTDYVLTALFQC